MPTVTVNQPSTIRVRVQGDASKVRNIGFNSTSTTVALKDVVDVDISQAQNGDVLTYDANTRSFIAKPIGGANTQVSGSLIPDSDQLYDLGSPTNKWKTVYLSAQTMYLGGLVFSQEPTTGAMAITPAPTEAYPDPKGIMITPTGNLLPVTTIEGKPIPTVDYAATVANTTQYLAFSGADAGFF